MSIVEIHGTACAFAETGTEGILWAVVDDAAGGGGYDGLYILENGDELTIYDNNDPSRVVWHGVIDLEYESHRTASEANASYVAQAIQGNWVRGLQRGVDADTWALFFFGSYPVALRRGRLS